jgi:type 1 glutamine amidotransferase
MVLVAGKKDHGPGEHDYPAWQIQWGQLLAAAPEVTVDAAWDFPTDQQLDEADVVIFFQKGDWDDHRQEKIDAYLRRGGGAVYIHWAVNGNDRAADFSQRIGLASRGGSIRYRHGPLTLNIHNTDHPIVRNFDGLQLYDESYWLLSGDVDQVTLLASSVEDGESRPQLWTHEKDSGRVFVSIPGHYSWTFDDPLFRVLLLRGIAWTAREPVDRFNELAPLGARIKN